MVYTWLPLSEDGSVFGNGALSWGTADSGKWMDRPRIPWTGPCRYGHSAVETIGEAAITPVVADRRRVGHGVTASYHHLVVDLISETKAGAELLPIGVVEPAAIVSENQGARPISSVGIGSIEVYLGHAAR